MTFRKFLSQHETIILDGGLATHLEAKGCDINNSLWSAEVLINNPELIEEVHSDYFIAGADVAITASYQASLAGLVKHRPGTSSSEAMELIMKSVQLAKNARDAVKANGDTRELFIAGSVGPYGAFLADGSEYRGDYELSDDEMMTFHRPRVQALIDAGVDLLAFETIPSAAETVALLGLLELYPDTDCWFSFTLKDEKHISDGTPLENVVKTLEAYKQVLAVGVNCIPESMAEKALVSLRTLTSKPLILYPNSGEVYDAQSKTWSGEHTQGTTHKEEVQKWHDQGARLIGGCCRTTPDDIRSIRDALSQDRHK